MMRHLKFTRVDILEHFKSMITRGPAFQFDMEDIARIRGEIETLINKVSEIYLEMKAEEKQEEQAVKSSEGEMQLDNYHAPPSGRLNRHKQGGDNKDNVSLGHDPPLLSEGHESSSPSRNSSNINTKSSNGMEKKMNGVVGGDEQCLQKLSSKTAVTKVKSPKSLVVDQDKEGVYNVKKILKCEKNGNKNPQYSPDIMVFEVEWVGYPAAETTWEPKENLIGAAGEYISSMFGEACVIYLIFSEI